MRFGVIGSGAVGCYYGGRLAHAGEEVHFLFRSDYEYVRENGLTVRSILGDFHVRVNAYRDAAEMPPVDVVVVALKGTDVAALPGLLPHNAAALCLMNGLGNEEFIATFCERVIFGSAFICSEKIAPGIVEHTAAGALRVSDRELADVFVRAGVPCTFDENGKRIKWSKLVWNIPFNGLSVYYGGATTDVILKSHEEFVLGLMLEVIEAAGNDGVILSPDLIDKNIEATKKMGAYRTSMMVDYVKGRPLEIESILAEPLRRGGGADKLPFMAKLLDGVRRHTRAVPLDRHGEI